MERRDNLIFGHSEFTLYPNCNLFYSLNMTEEKKENLISRPPVVVILGHIDHGKTTLLDFIRKTKVVEKESGGITQHIGAYEIACPPKLSVQTDGRREKEGPSTRTSAESFDSELRTNLLGRMPSGQAKKITFLDTPGHEAFSAMRARGANVADIAVLVIDGSEGVKEQTKEAITYIKKSGLPLVVAINKIDKPEANPEKAKRGLSQENILVESLGGKVPSVAISAKTGQNIDELLDLILLVAEMEELKGSLNKKVEGVVIEAYLDSQRGPTATLLIRDGILRLGDIVGTRTTLGKIKILEDFKGKQIKEALPSMPVITIGFEKVPQVGEKIKIYPDVESAQKNIEIKAKKIGGGQVFLVEPDKKVLNLIIKADVLGSLEAIGGLLKNLPQEKIILRILKGEVGEVNETDVKLAQSAKAKILGFRVKVNPIARTLAEKEKIRIMNFEVIYELAQAVRQLMEKFVEPEITRKDLGKIKTLIVFRTDQNRQIVGGKVIEGEVKKGTLIEVLRPALGGREGEEILGQGRLINLQKNKKDIEKCKKGDECGILYEGTAKIEEGDILLIYQEERRKGEI